MPSEFLIECWVTCRANLATFWSPYSLSKLSELSADESDFWMVEGCELTRSMAWAAACVTLSDCGITPHSPAEAIDDRQFDVEVIFSGCKQVQKSEKVKHTTHSPSFNEKWWIYSVEYLRQLCGRYLVASGRSILYLVSCTHLIGAPMVALDVSL